MLTIAIMNSCGAALTTIIQQFLYPVTNAPRYRKGFPASLGFIGGMCVWVFVVRGFEIRALRGKEVDVEGVEVESSSGEEAVVGKDGGVVDVVGKQ